MFSENSILFSSAYFEAPSIVHSKSPPFLSQRLVPYPGERDSPAAGFLEVGRCVRLRGAGQLEGEAWRVLVTFTGPLPRVAF